MVGEDLDRQVQAYLLELGRVRGMINKVIATASARGIVRKRDSNVSRKWWACVTYQRLGILFTGVCEEKS